MVEKTFDEDGIGGRPNREEGYLIQMKGPKVFPLETNKKTQETACTVCVGYKGPFSECVA